jgi:hypothetical protein
MENIGPTIGVVKSCLDEIAIVDRRSNTRSPKEWSQIISTSWQDTTAGIFVAGNHVLEACDQLGKQYVLTNLKLPFSKQTAERLMAIAGGRRATEVAAGPRD